jgi:hypothetical protein
MEYRSIDGNKSNNQCRGTGLCTRVERKCITERTLCTFCRGGDEEAIHEVPPLELRNIGPCCGRRDVLDLQRSIRPYLTFSVVLHSIDRLGFDLETLLDG